MRNESAKADLISRRGVEIVCWHCQTVLADTPIFRCEDCPDECDVGGCKEPGCSGEMQTTTSGHSQFRIPQDIQLALAEIQQRHRITKFAFEGQQPPQSQQDIDTLLQIIDSLSQLPTAAAGHPFTGASKSLPCARCGLIYSATIHHTTSASELATQPTHTPVGTSASDIEIVTPEWKDVEDAERLASPAIGKIKIPEWRAMVNDIAAALKAQREARTVVEENPK